MTITIFTINNRCINKYIIKSSLNNQHERIQNENGYSKVLKLILSLKLFFFIYLNLL